MPYCNFIPFFTKGVKYFPSKLTVSIPTWIKISTPESEVMPIACPVGKKVVIVPLTGEITSPFVGSIARPFPIYPLENTSSFTSDKGKTFPSSGV